MLQVIVKQNDKYSIAEQVQMVIEGGCQWVILRVPELSDGELRELGAELVPLCKETSTILTIENRIEMARELALHGVYVTPGCKYSPREVRDMFGPEAIIGVQVTEVSAALPLRALDIDYVSFPAKLGLDKIGENIKKLREADFDMPIVVDGDLTAEQIAEAMAIGANGLALSGDITDAKDPVAATENVISMLTATAK